MQFERSENYVPYFLQTLVGLGTLTQFERSENYVPYYFGQGSLVGTQRIFKNAFYLWYRRHHFLL